MPEPISMSDIRIAQFESSDLPKFGATWDAYVEQHPEATQYHQHAWPELIARAFGHRPIFLIAFRDEKPAGVFPLVLMQSRWFGCFLVSLPFVNYGGLLGESEEVEQALWVKAQEIARQSKSQHVEARHVRPRPFISHRKQHKVGMILQLAEDADAQWKAFDPKLRNQIRKAERSSLTARFGGIHDLSGFYEVFAQNMRDLGTPVYSQGFFEEVLQTFAGTATVCSVLLDNRVVAAGIAMTYRDSMEMPWASSLRDARPLCPNNLLYWTVIQHAIKLGLRQFDFGRSTPGEGTYNFKEQWGAQPLPLSWEYWTASSAGLPDLSPKNPQYGMAIQAWKRLPLWLTKAVGPRIVRHIP